jgi:hypothetical protein
MVSGFLCLPVKRPVREADLSPPTSGADVKIDLYSCCISSFLGHGRFYFGEIGGGVGRIDVIQGQVVHVCVVKAFGGVEI